MKIDEGYQQTPAQPERWEQLNDVGAIPSLPPTAEAVKDLGPFADTPSVMTQRELDQQSLGGHETVTEGQSLSPIQASLRRLGRDRRAMLSVAIVLLLVVTGYVGPLIYLHVGPSLQNAGPLGNATYGPEIYHQYAHQEQALTDLTSTANYPLGTDGVGRDNLARLMAGLTVSIGVGLLVVIFDIGLGILIGTLAGYYGGIIDTFLARFTDLMFAFPSLLFAILAAATLGDRAINVLGPNGRLILVSLAIAITVWPQMARYVRGQTLQLKEQQFIEAARATGTPSFGIILKHITPNLFNIVVTAATLDLVGIITAEATLSLLGLGVQDPGSSLGLMISAGAAKVYTNVTEVLWPTLALALLVLCLSFVGDGVQDAFNPRTKD
ncbi:MAG: ABC transporter permease [Ktedonobacterales bacterium]